MICVTVTRESPGGFDEYGDPVDGTSSSWPLREVLIAPRLAETSTERGREGTVIGLDLYCQPDVEIANGDVVTVPSGDPYAGSWLVEADPAHWRSPSAGRGVGVVAPLRRSEG